MKRFHKSLVTFAKDLGIRGIPALTRTYLQIYQKRRNSRGKADSIAFLKALLVCGERYALHQQIDPVPWTKSDKDNFPTVIKDFRPYLRGSRFQRILALSVLRSVEILRLPISRDISSVTDPPVYSGSLVLKILNFAKQIKWIKPLSLPKLKYHLTFKKGPNGPALKTSDSDIAGLRMDPKLLGAIQVVQEKLDGPYPLDNTFKSKDSGIVSKLTQFPEKAGKTRTIAVVDYYSQRALKPLHTALMRLLRSLKSDGTYSHRNVGIWAKQKTCEKSHIFCADLTAATDRFPAELQKHLLSMLVPDVDLASALWTLLAERTFTVAWSGEKVQYGVGQPMGAYASWPLFAIAHHVVAEYCLQTPGVKDKYRMIGDDFICSSKIQAQRYKEVMEHLGVSINFSKTVESPLKSEHSAAEVAKQLYLNGDNLTPLTPGFMSDIAKPHMFNMCLDELMIRYDPLPVAPSVLIESLFRKEETRQRVWLLASNPRNGAIKPSCEGYDRFSPWKSKDLGLYDIVYRNLWVNTLTMKAEILFDELLDSDEYGYQDSPRKDSDPRIDAQLHVEEQLRADLSSAMLDLNRMEAFAFDPSDATDVDVVQFIVDPRDQYKSRKDLRQTVDSYLIEQVLPELPERTSTKAGMLETRRGRDSMMG